jgi:hypothetical protein
VDLTANCYNSSHVNKCSHGTQVMDNISMHQSLVNTSPRLELNCKTTSHNQCKKTQSDHLDDYRNLMFLNKCYSVIEADNIDVLKRTNL